MYKKSGKVEKRKKLNKMKKSELVKFISILGKDSSVYKAATQQLGVLNAK